MADVKTQTPNKTSDNAEFNRRDNMAREMIDCCAKCKEVFPLVSMVSLRPKAGDPIVQPVYYYLVKTEATPEHSAIIMRCCAKCGKEEQDKKVTVRTVYY